jgi:glycopeptide antibiotics resistance protein
VLIVYVSVVFYLTVIKRQSYFEQAVKPPFWELINGYWTDIFLNMLLFVPVGFLIGGNKGLVIGIIISCLIETNQYFLHRGFCEIDDIINNTIGAAIGVCVRKRTKSL